MPDQVVLFCCAVPQDLILAKFPKVTNIYCSGLEFCFPFSFIAGSSVGKFHNDSSLGECTKIFQKRFRNMHSDNPNFELLMLIRHQFSFAIKEARDSLQQESNSDISDIKILNYGRSETNRQ